MLIDSIPLPLCVRKCTTSHACTRRYGRTFNLVNVTFVLLPDELEYWSYWLSLLASPFEGVRQQAAWIGNGEAILLTSLGDEPRVALFEGAFVVWRNVTFGGSNIYPLLRQLSDILVMSAARPVPSNCFFFTSSTEEIRLAFALAANDTYVQQFGQYIVLRRNVTIGAAVGTAGASGAAALAAGTPVAGTGVTWPLMFTSLPQGGPTCVTASPYAATLDVTTVPSFTITNQVLEFSVLTDQYSATQMTAGFGQLVSGLWTFSLNGS